MINTRILSQEFEYFEPKTVEETVHYLATHSEKAKLMAGGTDILVQMKMGKVHPDCLINISRIPGLRYLIEKSGLRIGSLITFQEIEKSQGIKEKYTALFEAARSVSSVQIKTMGTIGGNLCNASPAADSAPPLIAFGAKVKLVEANRERFLTLEDFISGPGATKLSPNEILVEVQVPQLDGQVGSAFLKMTRVSADLAKINVAVMIEREKDICRSCKIVLGAVAKTALRAVEAEKVLVGKNIKETLVERASQLASEEIQPITDVRSTAWYRREISKVIVRNAIGLAWNRAVSPS